MLDYEWENPSTIILSSDERNPHEPHHDPSRALSIFDSHSNYSDHRHIIHPPLLSSSFSNQHHLTNSIYAQTNQFHHSFYVDPRTTTPTYASDPIYQYSHHSSSASPLFSFDHTSTGGSASGSPYNFLIPKTEVDVSRPGLDFTPNRIGLNLGGRTYFSAADDDFVSRLYRRSRPGESGMGNSLSTPRCQAEGCNADLSHAKHYHRRHKVCEFHSKASTVVAAGLSQRFCQQCSRFHMLSEFDNGKRSCRKRLADHNRRRRKCHQSATDDSTKTTSLDTAATDPKSVNDSGIQSKTSPGNGPPQPTISLECFRYQTTTASSSTSASSSSNSMFFSSG